MRSEDFSHNVGPSAIHKIIPANISQAVPPITVIIIYYPAIYYFFLFVVNFLEGTIYRVSPQHFDWGGTRPPCPPPASYAHASDRPESLANLVDNRTAS